jgi:GDP-mannose 6-dehydrogenase
MKISIFGLGYVGCVSLGCLAKNGHDVIGVDVNSTKVDLINEGTATIVEKDIDEIIAEQHRAGRIRATTDYREAVLQSEVSLLCVGTPSTLKGHLNLNYIHKTAEQIGEALKEKQDFHTVVIRSTVLPGTNEKVGAIIESVSGKKRGESFAVVSNPEFLREGTAVYDYYHPSVTVIGGDDEKGLKKVASLYTELDAPVEITDIKIAEMIKYVNNSFHALKITFANEIGNVAKALGIDSHKLMDLFCKDTHLNISAAYLKPGFAYGGSCLPKDLKGLVTLGHDHYISTPLLKSVAESNEYQKNVGFEMVRATGKKNVLFIGLSFKDGTDDLRLSPYAELAERLIGKGYTLMIYDENVRISKLIGANKSFVEEHLPHLSELIADDLSTAILYADVVLLNHRSVDLTPFADILDGKQIIDLVNIKNKEILKQYEGICW